MVFGNTVLEKKKMMTIKMTVMALAAVTALSGCTTDQYGNRNTEGNRALTGAAIGAAGGAAVGALTGGNVLAGAALGSAAGAVLGVVTTDKNRYEDRSGQRYYYDDRGQYYYDRDNRKRYMNR
ncbi:hypothetical protein GCM10011529_26000 [Polymorphobacter glacialis]|uniref:Glycine zipper domain-containing protein n=2 Tax=Sandarakinorhabdus glacialis TaxID=1614636 RepID=A0A916ZXT4_9SPHN|nr:hypothetical protein GCM10011529_26000 [Polymorphobacter glacialis]